VEHHRQQDEREAELRSDVDELDEQGDALEQRGEEFERKVGEVREEWERKQDAGDVPGAQKTGDGAPEVED
jgi:chromosome segregation ATPase